MKCKSIIGILLLSLAVCVSAAENAWIGGDQSAVPGSTFHVNANWSTGVAPTNTTSDALLIDQDGANVRWISSSSGFYLNGPMTIGGTNNPVVAIDFQSNRTSPPSNDNPAQILMGASVSILGSNTTVRISAGLNLALNAEVSPFVLDPKATLCGDGMISLGRPAAVIGDYDYDNLRLQIGNSGTMPLYVLPGFVKTTGDLIIASTGSAGVNNRTTVSLNGKTLEGGSLVLGLKDIRPEAGDQSGFGSVDFSGGILDLAGDITFRSNPDGLKTDGTPLTEDSCLTDSSSAAAGGTLRLGGSFTNITTKAPAKWKIADVDFVLDGDGSSVQNIEVMSADLGDTSTSCLENYVWGSFTVKAGASAKLVDLNDNSSRAAGSEALYCAGLVVESGATLNLNGLKVYVDGDIVINGTVIENGGSINTLSAGLIRHYAYSLGTTANTAGLGMWTGPMAVGDINGDGVNELFIATMDEKSADDDCKLFSFNYDKGAITNLNGYPISDIALATGADIYFFNFLVEDLGNGQGPELHYSHSGYSRVYAIGESAVPHRVSKDENAAYGAGAQLFADIDNDGSKELICAARGTGGNVRVYDTDTQALKWAKYVKSDADIAAQVAIGDLDLDGSPEICALAKGSTGAYGLTAFRSNGDIYNGIDGNTVISNMPFASVISETFGGLAIANVDGDQYPEFIYAGNTPAQPLDGLTVRKQDGSVKFTVNRSSGRPNGFALLDVDRDNEYEILYADTLYSGDGAVLQTLPAPGSSPYFGFLTMPVLADFNGDQIPEAVYLCSKNSDFRYTRVVCVYDFISQSLLPGFPIDIKAILSDGASETLWYVGQFQHFGGTSPIVADLDNDGDWEIIIGTGIGVGTTLESPTLNIIDTPYQYTIPEGRRVEDYGWYSYRHGSLADFKFPLYVPKATVIVLR